MSRFQPPREALCPPCRLAGPCRGNLQLDSNRQRCRLDRRRRFQAHVTTMTLRRSLAASVCSLWLLQAFVVPSAAAATTNPETSGERRIWMVVGERRFAVTLADNDAARAFVSQLPLTLDMPDLNGNEKHQKLPKPLPTNVTRPGTIRNGDLMLWGADTLVVFYLTFDSPYSYTRLGRIEDAAALPPALGRGQVRVTFAKD